MLSNANVAASIPSLLAPTDNINTFSLSLSADHEGASGVTGLGVSTAAAPLISAPVSRQTPEFQSAIAPPSRPKNPSIAPPKKGGDNSLSGTGNQMSSMQAKLAYIAALRLEMATSGGNGPSGGKNEILSMMGKGQAAA